MYNNLYTTYRPVFLHLKFHTHDDAWRAFEILQNELNSTVTTSSPTTVPAAGGDAVGERGGVNPIMEQSHTYKNSNNNNSEIQTNKRTIGTGTFICVYVFRIVL